MEFQSPLSLNDTKIVLGITGGVAAYKSVELCRRLTDLGAHVSPILSASATRFIGPATFAALASESPRTSLWDSPEPSPHTTLGQSADCIVVAPATARIIASLTHGLSDDLLATTLLATRAPVVLCPAMHTEMWEHPAVQQNIQILRDRGVVIVEPDIGALAGGDVGVGRLAAFDNIINAVIATTMIRRDLVGVKILVTAGGTREPIDPVRFIGNRSSGKQGNAFAIEARDRGAEVTLVTTNPESAPQGMRIKTVTTAKEMHDIVLDELPSMDVVVMAAAIADFRPIAVAPEKIKKTKGIPTIQLERTEDVLQSILNARTERQIVVGFAAETTEIEANAIDKLKRKGLDLIVANDVSTKASGFEVDTNEALILDKNGRKYETGLVKKRTVAAITLNEVGNLLGRGTQTGLK